jgi:ligand-binding sensor domain-containing protein
MRIDLPMRNKPPTLAFKRAFNTFASMSFYRLFLFGFFSLGLISNSLQAQERQLGTWKSFTPFGASRAICEAGDKVFSASTNSVFSVDKTTGEVRTYDKSTGLSDIGIKTMSYDPATSVLAIAYNNSNLDLIYNETDIYNVADFKNENTSGSVGINGISFYNGNCYVSSDMGISVIDLTKKEIKNTYIIGSTGQQVRVYAAATDGSYIYSATQEGVKRASLTSANLQDFNSWVLFTAGSGIPAKKAKYVEVFNGKAYAVIEGNGTDTLYEFSSGTWGKRYFDAQHTITSLNRIGSTLYFTIWNNSNTSGKNAKVDAAGNMTLSNVQGHVRPIGWFESNGISWEGDFWNGLFKNNQGNIEKIIPDGPFSPSVFRIDVTDGNVNVAPGGVDDSWGFTYNQDGFFMYEDNKWVNINQYNFGALTEWSDVLAVASNTVKHKTYFGSFFAGLIEYDHNSKSVTQYDKWNSILEGAVGDTQRTKISSLTADKDGNVWIGNAGANKQIKMIPANGSSWKAFTVPYNISLMKRIVVDANGQLWAPVRRSGEGLLVWSNNGTLDNTSDDKARLLSTGSGSGALPDAMCHSIAEDKDGNIWVGTNQGIGIFYCPGSVLTNYGCDADQIKVERDGYVGYLFGTESVRAIAVDAANRKWIGTTNGVWLISADGKTELLKFNVDNSPLPSNQITDIAIDDNTGEVFIGTTGGLVSYQGDAMSECTECESALVYPNPVKPDYDGPIAIKGLVEDAYVKITDASGTLVYQGKANGRQMIWNGKGYNGQRAKSGVYLVFSSTDLGKEKRVAKILLVN